MAYIDSSINLVDASGEVFPQFGGDPANSAVYGVLLTRLKEFLCGKVSNLQFTSASPTGKGIVAYLEPRQVASASTGWKMEFTNADTCELKDPLNVLSDTAIRQVDPAGFSYFEHDWSSFGGGPGVRLYILEGDTPFDTGDYFTFDVDPSPLSADAPLCYDVVADTATGYGLTQAVLEEVLTIKSYGANTSTPLVVVTALRAVGQAILNETFYVDFVTATNYTVKNSSGDILGNASLGGTFYYVSADGLLSFVVTQVDDTAPTGGAAANLSGVGNLPPSISSGRNSVKISPNADKPAEANSRVNRVIVLQSYGLAGGDFICYTISQRVAGSQQNFSIELRVSPGFDGNLGPFNQAFQSAPCRIKHDQGDPTYEVFYTIIADGRHFYLLTRLVASSVVDPQALGGGLFLPHSQPADYAWPAFVGGNLNANKYFVAVGVNPTGDEESAFFSPVYDGNESTLQICLPTGVWVRGKNYVSGPIQSVNCIDMNNTSELDGAYTSPWVFHDAPPFSGPTPQLMSISAKVFGPSNRRVPIPGFIAVSTSALKGVIGEFPGLYFMGNPAAGDSPGDIIQISGTDYVVWKPTVVPANNAAVSAAFSKE